MVPVLSVGLGLPLEDTVALLCHEAADFKANHYIKALDSGGDEVEMRVLVFSGTFCLLSVITSLGFPEWYSSLSASDISSK